MSAGLLARLRGRRIWGLAGLGLLASGLVLWGRFEPSEARRGVLGASVYAVSARIAERAGMEAPAGVFVISVLDGYAAQEAGLKLGDILLSVDGVAVVSQGEFEAALRKIKPGGEVFFTRLGGEGPEEVAVRLQGAGARGASAASDAASETDEPGVLAAAEMHYARRLGLQFHDGAELWEMGAWDHPCLRSYLVPRGGVPVFLDGRAATVHGIAAQSAPDLGTEAQAAQYLRYYNGHIWAKAGAFEVIERAAELPGGEGAALARPGPVRIEGRGAAMQAEAVVLYAGQLFRARYAFGEGGRIKMLSDEKLGKISASDTVFRAGQRCATDGQSREATGYPVPPAMAGEWENVAGPEFYEVRQLILMGEG
ncbi:Protease precursor DegQ [Roseovarius nubinhibens ISM]|uniref:Protease DegQ n=1 Tax=Roseovarius nubinhibens (strain ATCC BAA-591 / DSM 15170 / ISM) TaxID=89187 RepID=A3SHR8_ROSNI|nr:Protease precursor DegQ [Roseovarius nubinhibens ISM]